ncbi:hypothetical protein CI610_01565 [invertebrate metagenome]|uniref:Thioredoxin domain-containing protein n=1 Tax=invertebrate metagenome TaxID=1711999 RepID=A0A2H9T8H8_9ZZZZ
MKYGFFFIKRHKLPLVIIVLSLVLVIFYLAGTTKPLGKTTPGLSQLGGDFILDSASGSVSLLNYRQRVVILYFGYLSCPKVCPASMSVLGRALNKLTPKEQAQVQGFFISLDPQRDSFSKLARYTAQFHDNIIGLSGSPETIADISEQYGVFYDRSNPTGVRMEYSVAHASRFYIVDKQGKLVVAMNHTVTPNELAVQIRKFLF